MATITTINSGDLISSSRTDINTNFANLNSAKIETSAIDTDTTLAANSDSNVASQKAVKAYVDAGGSAANLQRLLPTGTMLPYGAAVAPSFFLLCDGSAVSRTTYAALFAVIGTSYGAGNGSTTFNLPDARGRVIVGSGTGVKVATVASRASNVITLTGLSNIANNEFQTGQAVTYHTTSGVMTGLTNDTVYYVIRVSNTTISLATTMTNAQSATVISLSGDGSGVQTFTLTLTARSVGDAGGEESHAQKVGEESPHAHDIAGRASAIGSSSIAPGNGTAGSTFTGSAIANAGGVAANNMDPFMVAAWIIKT